MRDLQKETNESDAKVEAARCKIAAQTKSIGCMLPDDPDLPAARRLLDQMRHSAMSAEMNQAMMQYDRERED